MFLKEQRFAMFSHGQLYIAISRVTSKHSLKILIVDEDGDNATTASDVVYHKVNPFSILYKFAMWDLKSITPTFLSEFNKHEGRIKIDNWDVSMIIYFKVAIWLKGQVRNNNNLDIQLNNHKYYYKLLMNNQSCLLIEF
ncbi:hypothetical protein MTR_6g086725 [Medicago truncatula]|uniref:PIF1 helicase n=1 Tax=Medicago truncatula TaxID=3880 RepID=A0A072UBW1_MEDTR|nr:hypothetical protein MTR_6g086725 [Medicago truncatula]